jgi:hypothetical protein
MTAVGFTGIFNYMVEQRVLCSSSVLKSQWNLFDEHLSCRCILSAYVKYKERVVKVCHLVLIFSNGS